VQGGVGDDLHHGAGSEAADATRGVGTVPAADPGAQLSAVYWISPLDVHWYVETSADRVVATLPIVAGTHLQLLVGRALSAGGGDER
jgi:hypothetical protein